MTIEDIEPARRCAAGAAGGGVGRPTAGMLVAMSHELRTPLNAIIGLAQAMQLETLGPLENPRYREYLGDIDECAQHLADLIGQIVARAKAECEAQAA